MPVFSGELSMEKPFGFPKIEHLLLRTDVEALFTSGSRASSVYPLRAVYRLVDHDGKEPKVKVLLSVSKRCFKHAVDRNRAKRQLREAYRHHKDILREALPENTALHIGFLWLSNKPVKSAVVEERLVKLMQNVGDKLLKEQEKNNNE